jgi:hypothetical protein
VMQEWYEYFTRPACPSRTGRLAGGPAGDAET